MKWRGTEIKELSNDDLVQANNHVQQLKNTYLQLTSNIKYLDKFKNQPPPKINSALLELETSLLDEMRIRKNV